MCGRRADGILDTTAACQRLGRRGRESKYEGGDRDQQQNRSRCERLRVSYARAQKVCKGTAKISDLTHRRCYSERPPEQPYGQTGCSAEFGNPQQPHLVGWKLHGPHSA